MHNRHNEWKAKEAMRESEFQKSVSDDLNTIVRLQRERREVCWVCKGTGHAFVSDEDCVYCGGFGTIHIERTT